MIDDGLKTWAGMLPRRDQTERVCKSGNRTLIGTIPIDKYRYPTRGSLQPGRRTSLFIVVLYDNLSSGHGSRWLLDD